MLQIPHMTDAIIQEIANPGSNQKANTSNSNSGIVTSAASSSGSKSNDKKDNQSVSTAPSNTTSMTLTASTVASMSMLLQEYLRTPDADKKGLEPLSAVDKQEVHNLHLHNPHLYICLLNIFASLYVPYVCECDYPITIHILHIVYVSLLLSTLM